MFSINMSHKIYDFTWRKIKQFFKQSYQILQVWQFKSMWEYQNCMWKNKSTYAHHLCHHTPTGQSRVIEPSVRGRCCGVYAVQSALWNACAPLINALWPRLLVFLPLSTTQSGARPWWRIARQVPGESLSPFVSSQGGGEKGIMGPRRVEGG